MPAGARREGRQRDEDVVAQVPGRQGVDMQMALWNPVQIAEPSDTAIRAACVSHETMLVSILDAILARYERDPG